ncbi:transposase [Mycobacterium avium]|uniref:transposase n=1 Tax=Mycobacterium avium TaxID=1764 RepID=UPI0032479A1C
MTWSSFEESRDDRPLPGYDTPPHVTSSYTTSLDATRYQQASKRGKGRILDELCANTGWHRNHARKAFKAALQPKSIQEPQPTQEGQEARVVSLRLTSDYERLLYVVLPAFHLMTDVLKLFDQLSKTPT